MTAFRSNDRRNGALMAGNSSETRNDSLNVPWSDMVRFVRQLSHDLRNDLNALELQSAYMSELTQDPEMQKEVKHLRDSVSGLNSTLQRLSRAVGEVTPNLIPYGAAEFLADMRTEIERAFPNEREQIAWQVQLQGTLNVDPQLLQEVFTELFGNALHHNRSKGLLLASARVENDRFLFALQEPKTAFESSTQNWGREPLRNISPRHYGLGLNRGRAIVEAHGGELQALYDRRASLLVTTINLPVSSQ